MKYTIITLRILLGLPFVVFGINKFFGFLEMPPMEGQAGEFMSLLFQSGYLKVVGLIEIISGIMLLGGFKAPLALVLIFPININILLFHILFTGGSGTELGLILTLLNLALFFLYLKNYKPMLSSKREQ